MFLDDQPYILEFKEIGDPATGFLSVADQQNIPFSIQRVHWTYYTPDKVIRGNHAHKNLRQIIIAVAGDIQVEAEALDGTKSSFLLKSPHQGLYLPSLCWRRIMFTHGAVLLCLASNAFEENDYIRNYDDFHRYRLTVNREKD